MRRIGSAALFADGAHARRDALVSGSVILSALSVALGAAVADPVIGLAILALIGRITWQSWNTVCRGAGQLASLPLALRGLAISGVLVVLMANVVMPPLSRLAARR
jgi:Co/Zn/Cd efflux system component